jgi:hypothetical protein
MSRPVGVHDLELVARAVRFVARHLEPSDLSVDDLEAALVEAAAVESMGATMKVLLAARLAATGAYKATSASSPQAHVARLTGVGPLTARAQIEAGEQLGTLEATVAAARSGQLSLGQVQAIAAAASVDPTAEDELLQSASHLTLGQLRHRCAEVIDAADDDPEAKRKRLHRGRAAHRYRTPDGFNHLHVRSSPEALAEIDVTLNEITNELFRDANRHGRKDRREALMADAMVEMARRARGVSSRHGSTPTYTAVIRADLSALVNGRTQNGEVCEIAGVGPVPVATARALLGDAVLKLVLTQGVDVRNVTSLGRGPTAAQKVALLWEQPTCAVEHCGRRARLEADHAHGAEYARTKHTRLDELDRLCDQHHDKKTREDWALVRGRGLRPMVPPTDPRHPKHSRAP